MEFAINRVKDSCRNEGNEGKVDEMEAEEVEFLFNPLPGLGVCEVEVVGVEPEFASAAPEGVFDPTSERMHAARPDSRHWVSREGRTKSVDR